MKTVGSQKRGRPGRTAKRGVKLAAVDRCNTRDTFGWLIEFTPKAGINLCLGCDYLPYKWTPAPILESDVLTHLPTALAANVHFGLSLALGSKYGR